MPDASPPPSSSAGAPHKAPEPDGAEPELRDGLVVRSTGSWYDVRTDDGETVQARIRGRFRLDALEIDETNPLAVGDRVTLRTGDDGYGLVTAILPRRNQLSRRAAGRKASVREHVLVANVDAAWCMQSTYGPKFNAGFVDRFLVAAEAYHLDTGLVINKIDLIDDNARARDAIGFWAELYRGLGYPVLLTSAEQDRGVDAFRERLEGQVSVVSGPSGVGKSSLLNAIVPDLDLATSEVSESTQKGRHTTTFATLLPVAGGWVADTPGIREFGIWDMPPAELGGYFVEFQPHIPHCRFGDCTHDSEPGCAVQQAVDDGQISLERFGSYHVILEDVRAEYETARRMKWRTGHRPDDPDEPVEEPDEPDAA